MEKKIIFVKKKYAALALALALAAVAGLLSYAWFTSTADPIAADVTTAKIKLVNGTADISLTDKLPGEKVALEDITITNESTRNAVARLAEERWGQLKLSNQSADDVNAIIEIIEQASEDGTLDKDVADGLLESLSGEYITVDQDLYLFVMSSRIQIATFLPETGAAFVNGIKHFYETITNDEDFADLLESGIPALLESKSIAYAALPDGFYIALSAPNGGDIEDTIELGDLPITIPAALGGEFTSAYVNDALSYNWDGYFNEQESILHIGFSLKAVQATKSAVRDVFGLTDEDEDLADFYAAIVAAETAETIASPFWTVE